MNVMTNDQLDHALQVALRAADAAEAVIAKHYRQAFVVEIKSDDSPVTIADREAEQAIIGVLREAFPEHAFYGEEGGHQHDDPSGDNDYLWLIDPIDGTKAFVRSYPLFSTQIALMHRGELVLGVSSAGQFGERAWARRGGGAFINGQPVRVGSATRYSETQLSIGNVKTLAKDPRRWAALGELMQQCNRMRGYGDFLHYHYLARGAVDVVVESDVNILDIAALAVIVREAGGTFTDLDGAELNLQTRSVLASVPALHAETLRRLG
jgi:histidinol-phosphatase